MQAPKFNRTRTERRLKALTTLELGKVLSETEGLLAGFHGFEDATGWAVFYRQSVQLQREVLEARLIKA